MMPRFYFHVYDDVTALDDEGLVLASAERAKEEALKGARALASDQVCRGYLRLDHRIEIEDDKGARVATITFRDAIAVEG